MKSTHAKKSTSKIDEVKKTQLQNSRGETKWKLKAYYTK